MTFKTFLGVFAMVALGDGVVAILAPMPFVNLIWAGRGGPEAALFVQGWGACLLALSVVAWTGRRLSHAASRQWLALGLLTYHLIVSAVWFADGQTHGWTPLSALTLVALLLFALGFGYFRFAGADHTLAGRFSPTPSPPVS